MQPAATQALLPSAKREAALSGASWLLLMIAAPALAGIHVAFAAPSYPTAVPLLAGALATIALGSMLGASPNRLPFTMAFAVVTYLHYGSQCFREATVLTLSGPVHLSDDSLISAMTAATLGLLLLIGVTTALGRLVPRRRVTNALAALYPSDAALRPSPAVLSVVATLSLVSTAVMHLRAGWIPESVGYPILLVTGPPLYQALIYSALRRKPSPYLHLLFLGFTAAVSLTGALTGMLAEAALPWVGFLVLRYVGSGRAPWGLLAAGFVAFMILNPAKHAYRQRVWKEWQGEASISQRASAWVEAIQETWSQDTSDADVEANLQTTADRVSSLQSTAHTFEWVPALVPYAGLARWKTIPVSFIPRALWPNKPDLTVEFSNRYNLTFGLQTERGVERTTLNVTLISDAYWGAGWIGIVFAYLLVGCLLGFYEIALAPDRSSTLLLGLLVLLTFSPSAQLAHMVMGVPQRFGAALVVLWCLALLGRLTGAPTKSE